MDILPWHHLNDVLLLLKYPIVTSLCPGIWICPRTALQLITLQEKELWRWKCTFGLFRRWQIRWWRPFSNLNTWWRHTDHTLDPVVPQKWPILLTMEENKIYWWKFTFGLFWGWQIRWWRPFSNLNTLWRHTGYTLDQAVPQSDPLY